MTVAERQLLRELTILTARGVIRHKVAMQHNVRLDDRICHIDFAMPAIRLGVEVDGIVFNSTLEQRKRDLERDESLTEAGWKILRFTDDEVKSDPRKVAERIASEQ